MKNFKPKRKDLYILLAILSIGIAVAASRLSIMLGFGNSVMVAVFVVVLAIAAFIFSNTHIRLRNWVMKKIYTIPFFYNRMSCESGDNTIFESDIKQPCLKEEREKQYLDKAIEMKDKLSIALNYTQRAFALYASDEAIELLCNNLKVYVGKTSFDLLQPIVVSDELLPLDLYHFGWNIWNHFRVAHRQQIDMADFLKKTFPDTLKKTEANSIKSHLTDEPKKGIIKIKKSLLDH